jgi:DNA replication protein DnaC
VKPVAKDSLPLLLKGLKLPAFVSQYRELARKAEQQGWGFEDYLGHLAEAEVEERRRRRTERALRDSNLPPGKTLATLELARLPAPVRRQVPTLCEGGFVERAENLLAFGLPGRGKTHLVAAIGYELIARGFRVLFTPTYQLVQQLLKSKRDLTLEKEIRRLDTFDAVCLDDIGYTQQDRAEMEVLFTFLAERYERRSVVITSNLVFSQWDRIFKDPMTTAAAIDRVVHHAIILELIGPSRRREEAEKTNGRAKLHEPAPDNLTVSGPADALTPAAP